MSQPMGVSPRGVRSLGKRSGSSYAHCQRWLGSDIARLLNPPDEIAKWIRNCGHSNVSTDVVHRGGDLSVAPRLGHLLNRGIDVKHPPLRARHGMVGQHREIGYPRPDFIMVLLRHHPRYLRQVAEVVHHPCRQ